MPRQNKAASVPHRVFSMHSYGSPIYPLTTNIEDEGWDEFNKIIWGFQDFRDPFKYKMTLRRRFNPKVKFCDIMFFSSYCVVSGVCRSVIEEYDQKSFYYPVRIEDEKGNYVPDVEYYIFETRNFPGGEWIPPQYWTGRFASDYRLCQKQVAGHHVFRCVLDNKPIFVSETLKNRLRKEKFRYADYKPIDTYDVDWDPEVHLEPLLKTLAENQVWKQDFITRRLGWVKKYKPEWLFEN